jgi:hypothetical protein
MNFFTRILLVGLVLGLAGRAHAQLFVDYGGARNVFFNSGTNNASAAFTKIDTAEKSFSLNFWKLNQTASAWRFGGTMKATAQDDLTEIFTGKKAPKIEGNVLANWTSTPGDKDALLFSVTLRTAASEASYSILAPAATTPVASKFQAVEGSVTFACVPIPTGGHGGLITQAFALTVGAKKDTNYESLPLVDVGNGKTARQGTLEKFTSYPLQLLFVQEVKISGGGPLDDLVNTLRLIVPSIDKDTAKWVLLSPYVKATPRSSGSSDQAYGLNVAIKTLTKDPDPTKQVLKFPLSVFLESAKKAGTDGYVTNGGASVIFSF